MVSDEDLYRRGIATLLASWEAYAQHADGAALRRLDGVAAAVFPSGPAREIYNNAVLERADAIDAMEAAYASAGVERYAVWVRERDEDLRAALTARGYAVAESTRAMGRTLAGLPAVEPAVGLAPPDWAEHLRILGVPEDLLAGPPPGVRVVVARDDDGVAAATAHTLDHDGDCGIFNVTTVEPARRRGLGGALTARLLRDAAARGCTTASLQSSAMAEGVYAAAGFRDLGRILEYVPSTVDLRWFTGPRAHLRDLYALAEDSETQLAAYAERGRVLVAVDGEDVGNLRFYQRLGFRMLRVERDAFTGAHGYPDGIVVDGIPLRDRVWLSLDLPSGWAAGSGRAAGRPPGRPAHSCDGAPGLSG